MTNKNTKTVQEELPRETKQDIHEWLREQNRQPSDIHEFIHQQKQAEKIEMEKNQNEQKIN
jgi:phage regulator Rha-like protein